MIKAELTKRQEAYLTSICEYIDLWGWPPSLSEIMAIVGVKSYQSVTDMLARLEAKGWIERGHGARQIRVNYYPRGYLFNATITFEGGR